MHYYNEQVRQVTSLSMVNRAMWKGRNFPMTRSDWRADCIRQVRWIQLLGWWESLTSIESKTPEEVTQATPVAAMIPQVRSNLPILDWMIDDHCRCCRYREAECEERRSWTQEQKGEEKGRKNEEVKKREGRELNIQERVRDEGRVHGHRSNR